ncbi:MAG: hypothetical protein FWD08_01145 [Alphaproteobacteria bacterium]|nr:hypothetical protein [Alphaproteobacteria bacterium]MCL2452252.1 hypothetical protein [Alphaproteobacteria bacterium]
MGRFRQGSVARRAALSVFALYALLLQAFLATTAPASAFALPGAPASLICSFDGSDSSAPDKSPSHHGLCCILACAVAGCTYVGTASAAAPPLAPIVSTIRFGFTQRLPGRAPFKHYFAARGPPASTEL